MTSVDNESLLKELGRIKNDTKLWNLKEWYFNVRIKEQKYISSAKKLYLK